MLAVDDEGVTHRLVPKKLADPLLKKNHKINRSGSSDRYNQYQLRKQKAAKLKSQAGTEALRLIVEEVERELTAERPQLNAGWLEVFRAVRRPPSVERNAQPRHAAAASKKRVMTPTSRHCGKRWKR